MAKPAVIHFFWSNGIRYVSFIPSMTFFKTRDENHYKAIKNNLDIAQVPYYERPTNENVDARIYGIELKPQENVWTDTEVEYENQKGPDGKPLPINSGKGARDTMARSFQATNGQTYRNADALAQIIATQKAQGEAITALTKELTALAKAIADLPGSIATATVQ